ncbi:MAG: hypothetical protein KDB14_34930 [Planctomycetales bacterium]|nr:hypothetical protein [Planctomycetales bacterium]
MTAQTHQAAHDAAHESANNAHAAVPPGASSRVRWAKRIGSILICLHLLAVILAPASMPPASTSVQSMFGVLRPYIQFAYLNHGYHFFAPDPGPSSLLDFTVIDDQGNRTWHRMPDRAESWPRLLYHRRFMLTEFYGGIPPAAKEMRHAIASAYARQILEHYRGVQVEMAYVLHNLSSRREVLEGRELTDVDKYSVTPLGTFSLPASDTSLAANSGP